MQKAIEFESGILKLKEVRQFAMKRFLKLISVCVFFLMYNPAFTQSNDWVKDSLTFYKEVFWTKVKQKEFKKAKEALFLIENKGLEDLDSKIVEFFDVTSKREKDIPSYELMANLHRTSAVFEYYKGDITSAKKSFSFAKNYFEKAKLSNQVAGMSMNIGVMNEKAGFYDSAILNYKEALPIFIKDQDTSSLASVYENISLAYNRISNYDKALEYLLLAEPLLESYLDKNSKRWIGFFSNKNMVLNFMNRHDEGINYLFKALKIAEFHQDKIALGKIYQSFADVYKFKGERDKEFQSLMKSKAFLKDTQNYRDIADLDYALLSYYFSISNLDSARYYAQRSLDFFEPNGYTTEVGNVYGWLGGLEFEIKNYKESIKYFQKALSHFNKEDKGNYAGHTFNIGYSYTKMGDYKSALLYLDQALSIRKDLGDLDGLQESYQAMAETYERMGDYKKAYAYLTLHQTYKDSVFNERKFKQLSELETQYETEKKDQAIAELQQEKQIQNLLAQKQQTQIYLILTVLVVLFGTSGLFYRQALIRKNHNRQLEMKNKEIAKQNSERELLLKEIHHRVKNNLQIISSLLNMQTRSLHDPNIKNAMKESQSRVKTMALIHEKLYQYENLSKINMQEYIKQLSDFLSHTYQSEKQININIKAENIVLDMDMAIPLGLITNELLSNSLKYAFEETNLGEITISFDQKADGKYKLIIADTGKGLDPSLNIENSKSLGLKLVKTLTRQINGQMRVVHSPGTTFEIEFNEPDLAA